MSPAADGPEHHGTLDAPTSDWWNRFADDAASRDRSITGTSRTAAGSGLAAAGTTAQGRTARVAPAAANHGEVQAAFVAWKGPQLVRLARTLLRDQHQAEDVVQDVLATALSKWRRIQSLDDPSAYLNRMLVNAVISSRLRPWRREEAIDPACLPERVTGDGTDSHAERQRCLALLRQLPDKQRIAIVLRLYEGLPDAEIAELMGCSTVTVRSNAHRGLTTLRRPRRASPVPEQPQDRGYDHAQSTDLATRLLLEAFDMDVRNEPVDQDLLNVGVSTRRRRRRRTRRLKLAGAALFMVAAVPLAVQAWPTSTVSTAPAGQSLAPAPTQATADASSPTASPSTTSTQTSVPTAPPSTSKLANPNIPVAYDIPDMTRAVAALPAGMSILGDNGQYPLNPTVMGQACSSRPFDPPMVAGRQFSWVNETQRWPRQEGVDLVVTGRATGGGPVAFDALVANSGVCRFTEDVEPFDLTIAGAEQTWAAQTDSQGLARVSGAARVGDLIVGVSIWYPQDGRTELAAVLNAAVADLQASGLAAADGR